MSKLEIVQAAVKICIRWEYSHRGRDYENGLVDCFGLVKFFLLQLGYDLPDFDYPADWADQGLDMLAERYHTFSVDIPIEQKEPGDVLIFKEHTLAVNHMGIYIGGGRMIECRKEGIRQSYLRHRLKRLVRIIRPTEKLRLST